MRLSIIVAAAENGVIGRDGGLPWHLSSDLKRFKRLTVGHCLIMGRGTYESIGRPLAGRVSIVLSRQPDKIQVIEGVLPAGSLEQALQLVGTTTMNHDEAFVIGGAELYRLALPRAERIYLTRVQAEVEGDVFLPEIDWNDWSLVEETKYAAGEKDDFPYKAQVYDRR